MSVHRNSNTKQNVWYTGHNAIITYQFSSKIFRLKKVKLEVLIRIQCNIAGKYPIFLKIKKMDITGYNLNAPLSHTEYSVIFLKIKTIFILIMMKIKILHQHLKYNNFVL